MQNENICNYHNCSHQIYQRPSNNKKCIFHSNKDAGHWHNIQSVYVKEFWQEVRIEIGNQNKDHDCTEHKFEGYIFPVFESLTLQLGLPENKQTVVDDSNFFLHGEELTFMKNVVFEKSSFIDTLRLNSIEFQGELQFSKCTFHKGTEIFNIKVLGKDFQFSECSFPALCYIMMPSCDSLWFMGNDFKYGLHIESGSIRWLLIEMNHIFQSLTVNEIRNLENIEIESTFMHDEPRITLSNFDTKKMKLKKFTGHIKSMQITNVQVSDQVVFKSINFNNTDFNGLNLEKANNINLQDVSFHGAILNDIEWGDITKERYMTSRKEMSDYYPTEEPKRNIIRQLKYILDSQADIINANKLYGLEMKLYGDSLSWKNFFDKLVFYFHNVSSSYSQSWILPLFWIFVIGFVFSGANCLYVKHNINEYLILGTLFFIILPIISLLSIY